MSESEELAATRARLAEIERELAALQARHDLAMSAFKFDEANAVQRRIGALEDERRAVAASLPEPAVPPEPAPADVPALARLRWARRVRRRRG